MTERRFSKDRTAASAAGDLLALAAAPVFGVMALVTATDDQAAMLCLTDSASPLGGMSLMYLLMSALHLAPWLKRVSTLGRRSFDVGSRPAQTSSP